LESTVLYILIIILVLWSQQRVRGAYEHFSKIPSENHISGSQIARSILDSQGLSNVTVEISQKGLLSDHFDPKTNQVYLSPKVYNDDSIASVAIAAHEVGHAIQYAEHYGMVGVRNAILPVAIVSGYIGWVVLIIGLISKISVLFTIGFLLVMVIAVFQLITLPIEFNASSRALKLLSSDNYISVDEGADAKAMLSAAALTYVVALLATLLQIARFVLLNNRRR